jgi:hypothetical protein
MKTFRTVTGLNLRSSGIVTPDNIMLELPQGQIVIRIGTEPDNEKWWNISTSIAGKTKKGFVNKLYLAPTTTGFGFPSPDSNSLGEALELWATFYFLPTFENDPNGQKKIGVLGR